MKQNLKKELKQLYSDVPPIPDSRKMAVLMAQARSKAPALPRESSLLWFIRTQIRFVNRKFLLVQLVQLNVKNRKF